MPQEILSLKTVHLMMDGQLGQDFDELLRSAILDCIKKPTVRKARTLELKLTITPVQREDGSCENVAILPTTASKVPTRPCEAYVASTTVHGGAKFMPSNPLNPHEEGES